MNLLNFLRVHPLIASVSIIAALLFAFSIQTFITTIDAEKDVVATTKKRLEILKLSEEFDRAIGYGGFIHNFKNYILRQDDEYFYSARQDITKSLALLQIIEKNTSVKLEVTSLQNTRLTLLSYIDNLSLAQNLVEQGLSASEIDARVQIDDKDAIKEIGSAAELIRNRLDQEIESLDNKVQKSRDQLLLLMGLFAATMLAVLGLVFYTSRVTARESKLKDLLDAEKAELLQSRNAETLGGVGHWLYTVESDQLEWSDGIYAIHGITSDTPPPHLSDAMDFYHPDDREEVQNIISKARENKRPFEFVKRIIKKNGEERTVQVKGEATNTNNQTLIFGVMLDITEQVKRELNLQQITERFDLVRNSITMGIWEIDLETHALSWDSNMFSLYNIDEARFHGNFNDWISRVHPDDVAATRNAFQEATTNQGIFDSTYRICLPDGDITWINSRAKVVAGSHENSARLIGISLDVTDAKTAEAKIKEALNSAQKASAAKSDFLAVMSHEIRTPLNGLQGMLQLLSRKQLDPDSHFLVETARTSSNILLNVLTDILEMSRIEAGKLELNLAPFNVARMLQQTINLYEPTAAEKGLRINYIIPEDSTPVLIGDEPRIRQILGNFISNAVKFSSSGDITISCALTEREDGKHVDFYAAVIDQGIGIPDSKLANLFKPFEQIDNSRTRAFGGTGLGLSICKHLAEAMGGKVGVRSSYGSGSSFWVELGLPIGSVNEQLDRFDISADDLPRYRILAAEDVRVNQLVLDKMLRETLQQDLTIVDNGMQAIDALNQEKFDLVLMDVQMPIMDGVEATETIRASKKPYANIPIVGLTANALKTQQEEYIAAGMNYCITKPVDWGEFLRVVRSLLNTNRVTSTSELNSSSTDEGTVSSGPKPKSNQKILDDIHKMLGAEKFHELINELSVEFERQIILMKNEPANAEIIMICTHTLRGICAYYELHNILSIVRNIEKENNNPVKVVSLLERLEQEVEDLLQLSKSTIGS